MRPVLAKILAGALAAAVLTAIAATASFAQTPEPKPAQKPHAERANALLDTLAGRLGKTPEELRAAVVAAQKDLIAKAVAAGRLTQEQANGLTQRLEHSGGLGALRAPKIAHAKEPAKAAANIAVTRELAQFLNMQPRELNQELRAGKSLAEVAQAKGKSRDDLKTFLTNQARARFDKAVADGKLTRAQADERLKRLTDRLDQALDHKHAPGGHRTKNGPASRPHTASGSLS